MRIGIFGAAGDPQCEAVIALLGARGVPSVLVDTRALEQGTSWAFDGERFTYQGDSLDDVAGWYLRQALTPYAPSFASDEQYVLFRDWFVEYMQRRERAGFQLSWLLTLLFRGLPVVNPAQHGSIAQLKAFQFVAARAAGLTAPRTLITNDPERVRRFAGEVGEVVYKPSMGGGLCHILDEDSLAQLELARRAPVTFQERVRGESVRVTIVGEEIVSSVAIPTEALDYRADPEYVAGHQLYELAHLPPEIPDRCRTLMRECGLLFGGLDFIKRADGSVVFLEANSSPIYLDIERKTGAPITEVLVDYLLKLAHRPELFGDALQQARTSRSFASYALPMAPHLFVGGER